MKNPFKFLYYTGLLLFLTGGVFITVIAMNIQNLISVFSTKNSELTVYPEIKDSFVLENLKPKEELVQIEPTKIQPKSITPKTVEKPNEDTVKSTKDSVLPIAEPKDSSRQTL